MDDQKTAPSELEKQLNRKSIEMKSIQQIGRALSSELRIDRLLMLVIEEVNKLMDSERGTFYIVDNEKGELWSKRNIERRLMVFRPLQFINLLITAWRMISIGI